MLNPASAVYTSPVAEYEISCDQNASDVLQCVEFAKLSNVIYFRGYMPNTNYQAYPRLVDSSPTVYALYGASYTSVLNDDNYFMEASNTITKTTLASYAAGLTASSFAAVAFACLAVDQLF